LRSPPQPRPQRSLVDAHGAAAGVNIGDAVLDDLDLKHDDQASGQHIDPAIEQGPSRTREIAVSAAAQTGD
jgi:hypothetical protein